jgi:uncharacterized membrane protein
MRAELRITLYSFMAVLTIAVQGYAQPQYTVTDLGAMTPFALTDTGMACGYGIDAQGNPHPAVSLNGQVSLLQAVHGFAYGCNRAGQVVGMASLPGNGFAQAFLWDATGLHWLVGPNGETNSAAHGINDLGEIAVHYYTPLPNGAVRRVSARVLGAAWTPLPSLSGGFDRALDINAQGDILMTSEAADASWHVTIATAQNALIDLVNTGNPSGEAINNAREVVGTTTQAGAGTRAFVVGPSQPLSFLPVLSGFEIGRGHAIDGDGTVVGDHRTVAQVQRSLIAVKWKPDGTAVDLQTLIDPASGWTLQSSLAIRDGVIVGSGFRQGQAPGGFMLTPVDTPPSLAIRLNQTHVAPGQTLRMALEMRNPGPMLTTDHYVGIILPDGQTVLWLTNTAPLEGVVTRLDADPRTFTPMLRNVSWRARLDVTQEDYLSYRFTGVEAPGIYHLLVGWTEPGSLDDGRIDEGDVLALDWKAVQFTGPASNLAAKAQEIPARHATE